MTVATEVTGETETLRNYPPSIQNPMGRVGGRSGGLKGHGDSTGGLQGGGVQVATRAAMVDQGTRAAMADTGTPWAMAVSLPPQIFLGKSTTSGGGALWRCGR